MYQRVPDQGMCMDDPDTFEWSDSEYIQDLVDACPSGGVVNIPPGTYYLEKSIEVPRDVEVHIEEVIWKMSKRMVTSNDDIYRSVD